jgi:peroxiredoxin
MDLHAEIAAHAAKGRERRPAEVTALFDRCIEDVRTQGVADRALGVGVAAPGIALPDAHGAEVRLADLLADGPAVLTFYRGGWCPYCNLELRAYAERMPDFDAAGIAVVAISPQTPDASLTQVERDELPFTVLSDVGNTVASAFGLVHAVPPELEAIYVGSGHQLARDNAQEPGAVTLPLPATYVVDREGIIRFAAVSADYKDRADPDEVLAVARALA